MSKVKIVFWLAISGFFAMVIFQNQGYFMSRHTLDINLFFTRYQAPQLPNLFFLMVFFLIGFLIAYFFSLYEKYRNNQVRKNLNQQLTARADTIARLETENDSLKSAMAEAHPQKPSKESVFPDEKNDTEAGPEEKA